MKNPSCWEFSIFPFWHPPLFSVVYILALIPYPAAGCGTWCHVVLPKCRAAKVLCCQNDCCLKVVLPKCRSAEMWRVPKCRSVKMLWCQRKKKCHNVMLPKCCAAKMLCYQSVFCQNVVLPICPLPGCRAAQVVVMPKCVLPNCRVFQIVRCREVGEPPAAAPPWRQYWSTETGCSL